MNSIKKLTALFAFALLVFGLPTLASAQRDRDRDRNNDDDGYNRNDRNRRNNNDDDDNDDNDDYDRNNRRNRNDRNDPYNQNQNGNYNRNLNATIKNLKNRSREFVRRLDRELDNSRYNNSNREDKLLSLAQDFKNATARLDDRYDNSRDYSNSSDEARRVIQIGQQMNNALYRSRLNSNLQGDWNRIQQDLNVLSNAYNYNNRNNRNNRNTNNGDWRSRIPFPLPF